MGDGDLSISGGPGGVRAHYEDMLSYARVIDTAGDGLRETSRSLGGVLVSADFAQAAVLCPAEVGTAELAVGAAATGPHGALLVSGELEVTARLVRWSVELYEFTDEQLARLDELGLDVAGFAAGTALPGIALVGGLLFLSNPELSRKLAPGLLAELQQQMYDHPWLEEALTRSAPGLVQGGAFSLAALLSPVAGPLALTALSGGNWPTGDYQHSIAGLLALAGYGGLLQDTGSFTSTKTGAPHTVDFSAGQFLERVYREQRALSQSDGNIQIVKGVTIDGKTHWIVQIPGTQDWSSKRGDNPVDLTTNTRLEAMTQTTKMQAAVADAMRKAGIGSDDPVMLTGHSQGGITAAAMASDPDLPYKISSVVTAGSPIGRFHIPSNVSVMSLEQQQDIVPKLDGTDNPDQPNWITVERDLTQGEPPKSGHSLGAAHDQSNYAQTGHEIDGSTSATIAAWRKKNAAFMDSHATAQQYHVSPGGG